MRVHCIVAECRRTIGRDRYVRLFKHDPGTWICAPHWRRVTKAEKRVDARLRRLARRYGDEAVRQRAVRVWQAIVRRAADPTRIGREVGL